MIGRRTFLGVVMGGAATAAYARPRLRFWRRDTSALPDVAIREIKPGEDVFAYVQRVRGRFDDTLYKQVLGAANAFKDGDRAIGVAAADVATRTRARALLGQTRIVQLDAHPLLEDQLHRLLRQSLAPAATAQTAQMTLNDLKQFLSSQSEDAIKAIMPSLSSETIGCVVKLMSNEELIALGSKVFNPLPGSRIGAKGYYSALVPEHRRQ